MKHVNIDNVGACGVTCPEYAQMMDAKDAPTSEGDYYLCNTHEQYWSGVQHPDHQGVFILQMVDRVPRAARAKIG